MVKKILHFKSSNKKLKELENIYHSTYRLLAFLLLYPHIFPNCFHKKQSCKPSFEMSRNAFDQFVFVT